MVIVWLVLLGRQIAGWFFVKIEVRVREYRNEFYYCGYYDHFILPNALLCHALVNHLVYGLHKPKSIYQFVSFYFHSAILSSPFISHWDNLTRANVKIRRENNGKQIVFTLGEMINLLHFYLNVCGSSLDWEYFRLEERETIGFRTKGGKCKREMTLFYWWHTTQHSLHLYALQDIVGKWWWWRCCRHALHI